MRELAGEAGEVGVGHVVLVYRLFHCAPKPPSSFLQVDDSSHDVWQAFLFARKGEWEEVEVPLSRFLLTWKGKVCLAFRQQLVLLLQGARATCSSCQAREPHCLMLLPMRTCVDDPTTYCMAPCRRW